MVQKFNMELAPEELEELIKTADKHLRSARDQARHFVREGLKQDNKTKNKHDKTD